MILRGVSKVAAKTTSKKTAWTKFISANHSKFTGRMGPRLTKLAKLYKQSKK